MVFNIAGGIVGEKRDKMDTEGKVDRDRCPSLLHSPVGGCMVKGLGRQALYKVCGRHVGECGVCQQWGMGSGGVVVASK